MSKTAPIVVLITASSEDEAAKIANSIVEKGLAACVNIVPSVRSIYKWEGKLCDEKETMMVVKTTSGRLDALTDAVTALHSYSTPEIIAVPVSAGSEKYLKWVFESVGEK